MRVTNELQPEEVLRGRRTACEGGGERNGNDARDRVSAFVRHCSNVWKRRNWGCWRRRGELSECKAFLAEVARGRLRIAMQLDGRHTMRRLNGCDVEMRKRMHEPCRLAGDQPDDQNPLQQFSHLRRPATTRRCATEVRVSLRGVIYGGKSTYLRRQMGAELRC